MKPEEKAEIVIYNALRPLVNEIYFNRKNKLNCPIFKCSGSKTPDLILKTRNNKYIVLEVKPAINSRNLQQGVNQLFDRYYLRYSMNQVKYFIDNKVIIIDHFAIISDCMITKGHLFRNKELLVDNLKECSQHKSDSILKYKIMPRYEYSRTYDIIRSLFATFREFRLKKPELLLNKAGLGIIMKDYETKKFMLFTMCYTKQWRHHYWEL